MGNGLTEFLYDQFMKWFYRVRFTCPDYDNLEFEMLTESIAKIRLSLMVYTRP